MLAIGQCYRVMPAFSGTIIQKGKAQAGKIVYIHPKGRYAVLEFDGVCGRPRECFWPEELTEDNRVSDRKGRKRT